MRKVGEYWQKTKEWVKAHKMVILLGSVGVVAGVIGIAINANKKSLHEESEEIFETLDANLDSDEDNCDPCKYNDRYVIDADLMAQLPAGTYDVFDMYENKRVNYVIEANGSMET